jgi:hypothetical protein
VRFFQKQPINIGIFTLLYILYAFFIAARFVRNMGENEVFFGIFYFILHILILIIASIICASTGRGQIGYYRWLLYPWLALHLLFLFDNRASDLNRWFSVVFDGEVMFKLYLALNSILVISSVLPPYPARSSKPFSFRILLELCLLPLACLGVVLFGGAIAQSYNQVFLEINPWRAENPAYTVQSPGTYLTSRDGKFMQFVDKGICSFSKSSNRQSYLAVCEEQSYSPGKIHSIQVIQTVNGKRIQEQMFKGAGANLSPDAKTIAVTDQGGNIVFRSSTNPSQVFLSVDFMPSSYNKKLSWSPNSQLAIFEGSKGVYIVDFSKRQIRLLTQTSLPGFLQRSPNSQVEILVLESDEEVDIIDFFTGQVLTQTPMQKPRYDFLQWSPDSRQILLKQSDNVLGEQRELYHLFSADGKTQRQIGKTFRVGSLSEPSWSPDGRYIVMIVAGKLTLYEVATGQSKQLNGLSPLPLQFFWSPDSQKLALLDKGASEIGLALGRLSVLDLRQPGQAQSIYQVKKGLGILGMTWLDNDRIAFSRWSHPKRQLFGIPIRTPGLFVIQVSTQKSLPIAQYVMTDDPGFMSLKDNTFSFFVGPFHIIKG